VLWCCDFQAGDGEEIKWRNKEGGRIARFVCSKRTKDATLDALMLQCSRMIDERKPSLPDTVSVIAQGEKKKRLDDGGRKSRAQSHLQRTGCRNGW
jgi:hypothetical protein